MSDGWIEHDGKGVPADAKPGVTWIRLERPVPGTWIDGSAGDTFETVWKKTRAAWDWANFGARRADGRVYGRVIAYRNPSTTAAVEALKAIARNPERVKEDATP